jgi:hypothetical protein
VLGQPGRTAGGQGTPGQADHLEGPLVWPGEPLAEPSGGLFPPRRALAAGVLTEAGQHHGTQVHEFSDVSGCGGSRLIACRDASACYGRHWLLPVSSEEAADADDGGVIVIPIVGTAEEDEDASDRVRRAAARAGSL